MGELMGLLGRAVCALCDLLAVPFCVLLAAATVAGFITLAVCLEIEVRRDRQRSDGTQ